MDDNRALAAARASNASILHTVGNRSRDNVFKRVTTTTFCSPTRASALFHGTRLVLSPLPLFYPSSFASKIHHATTSQWKVFWLPWFRERVRIGSRKLHRDWTINNYSAKCCILAQRERCTWSTFAFSLVITFVKQWSPCNRAFGVLFIVEGNERTNEWINLWICPRWSDLFHFPLI